MSAKFKGDYMSAKKMNGVDDALSVLNKVASENTHDIKEVISDDYKKLKKVMSDLAPEIQDRANEIKDAAVSGIRATGEELRLRSQDAIKYSRAKAKEVDAKVKRSPWTYLGGAAAGSLLVGYIMGRKNRK